MNTIEVAATKYLIVTADDLGIDIPVSEGIVAAHQNGLVTSAALLISAPATDYALKLIKNNPKLEVGLHLAIVESFLTVLAAKSLKYHSDYFKGAPCLYPHWKNFIPRFVLGQIKLADLEKDFRGQIEKFMGLIGPIPFINGTQHLHLLPGIQDLVIKLCLEYNIPAVRIPLKVISSSPVEKSSPMMLMMKYLGWIMKKKAAKAGLAFADCFGGFDVSGTMTEENLLCFLQRLPSGTTELCCHPGYESPMLKEVLPKSYDRFAWPGELSALTSTRTKDLIRAQGIQSITFRYLAKGI